MRELHELTRAALEQVELQERDLRARISEHGISSVVPGESYASDYIPSYEEVVSLVLATSYLTRTLAGEVLASALDEPDDG